MEQGYKTNIQHDQIAKKERSMRKSIVFITGAVVLFVSGLVLAQMEDKAKNMTSEKAGMTEAKGSVMGKGMMRKGMMGGKGMMKMMRMMQQMHPSMVASSDGGVIVLSGGKLTKYDIQLNVVKQVDLPKPEMGMMGKGMGKMDMDNDDDDKDSAADKTDEDHAAHH
jgi:hypothetical protein